jgi:hypothetical protein
MATSDVLHALRDAAARFNATADAIEAAFPLSTIAADELIVVAQQDIERLAKRFVSHLRARHIVREASQAEEVRT